MVVSGSRPDVNGGNQAISFRVKKTIQSIKEIVSNHSDQEIYAMLKETNMDPNETAQKLLNQDPFHEVKRRRDKKKEHVGYGNVTEARKITENNTQLAKLPTSWDRNSRRGGYSRNPAPGISREFRIVRDNRVNQNASSDAKPEMCNEAVLPKDPVKISSGVVNDQKYSASRKMEGHMVSQGARDHRGSDSSGAETVIITGNRSPLSSGGTRSIGSVSTSQVLKEAKNNSLTHAMLVVTNSVTGVCSSSSDPVHVPNSDSRTAGTVGAIRRDVGVVGGWRQSSDRPGYSPVSNGTSTVPSPRNISSGAESVSHPAAISRTNQFNQTPSSEANMPSLPSSRSFSSSHSGKGHQQTVGHPKAVQPNMEWKPKPSKQSPALNLGVIGTRSAPSTSCTDDSSSSSPVDAAGLASKLSQVNILENQHVIIPQHLRVPESERTQLTFGSFGIEFDSIKGFPSSLKATERATCLHDEPSFSVSASIPLSSSEDTSGTDQGDLADGQARNSQSESPASAVESDQPATGNDEPLSPKNIEILDEIGLMQSHSHPFSSPEPQVQHLPSLPSFSAYDAQSSYDIPFFRTVLEDHAHGQGLALPSEVLSSHVASSSLSSTVVMAQQQVVQQQQQPVTQLYPQVQISHFPNYMPYRPIFSPMYVPPMAISNYPSNPSYPHPSNGSNYLLMPGGSSHLTASGIKYAASQYKPVPAGSPAAYGNYANSTGFAINTPSSIASATGLDDAARVKYKDNNLYVPSPQVDSSDIWIQTPRELPGLQSAPYYNLSGQAPHAAFLPTHTGHASFNAAAQSSHIQYPGLYHPSQAASIPSSHHLVHQQVTPGFGGGVGVGVAAPAPQIGTYQQPQMSHLNWNGNF